jgi:hypothetical protein
MNHDQMVVRRLAQQVAEIAAEPIQDERRDLWRRHFNLMRTRIPIVVHFGYWNAWAKETFGDHNLQCQDPFYREHERNLRILLFQDWTGDDTVIEPWYTLRASMVIPPGGPWGMSAGHIESGVEGGSFVYDPPMRSWEDMERLVVPRHQVDEAATARSVERLGEALEGVLELNLDRSPVYKHWNGDISYNLAELRGLNQIMLDLVESPRQVHQLAAFLRDGTLKAQAEADAAGDWSLADTLNQSVPYCEGLPPPRANAFGCSRKDLWLFIAAQEFTLVSPRMFDEFVVQYQLPIIEHFGLVHYGCCEDLTPKIKVLRQIKNLRSIAVTPVADVARCAEQIGTDYVFSWRPNPTDMICAEFDPQQVAGLLKGGLEAARDCFVHINLKDIETVQGDLSRIPRWVQIAREVTGVYA